MRGIASPFSKRHFAVHLPSENATCLVNPLTGWLILPWVNQAIQDIWLTNPSLDNLGGGLTKAVLVARARGLTQVGGPTHVTPWLTQGSLVDQPAGLTHRPLAEPPSSQGDAQY